MIAIPPDPPPKDPELVLYRKAADAARNAERAMRILRHVVSMYVMQGNRVDRAPDKSAPQRPLDDLVEDAGAVYDSSMLFTQWLLGVEVECESELKALLKLETVKAKSFSRSRIDYCGIVAHVERQIRTLERVFTITIARLGEKGRVTPDTIVPRRPMTICELCLLITKFTQSHESPRLWENPIQTPPQEGEEDSVADERDL